MAETKQLILTMQDALSKLSKSLDNPQAMGEQMGSLAIVQACFGILETAILPPELQIVKLSLSYQYANALAVVVDLGIAELLSTGGEEGLSSIQLEAKCGMPRGKISRLLRLLTGRGFFEEIKPDVWRHTRASKALDSGLTYEAIVSDPLGRYEKGPAAIALLWHHVEHCERAGAAMVPAYRIDKYKKSYKPNETPFNFDSGVNVSWWDWAVQQDEGKRIRAFSKGMEVLNAVTADFANYPWHELGENATLVDVGGGIGSADALILSLAPNIKQATIQDQPQVLAASEMWWKANAKDILESGKVVFQQHDFFTEQTVKGASVYFMRGILHDWADEECVVILKHLRAAAGAHSRLLVMDAIVEHACRDLGDVGKDAVEGAYPPPMPAGLPANGGYASEVGLSVDILMMSLLNGQERTHKDLKRVAAMAGWKAKKVYREGSPMLKITEFVKE